MNYDEYFFIGFISNYGDVIRTDDVWFNHTKLAEKIVAEDKLLQMKMSKSKHYIAIDFLIHDMGYLKVGNRNRKEILYSSSKKLSKEVKDYILLYRSLGYREEIM